MIFLFVLAAVAVTGTGVRGQVLQADLFRPSPTSFTCRDKPAGYYADVETGCRTYHVCDGVSHFTYVCPRRTLFRQESRICDHSYLVRCGADADEDVDRNDEEEILARLAEFKKTLLRIEDDDDQTQTETTPFEEPTGSATTIFPPTTTPIATTTPARTTLTSTTQDPTPEAHTAPHSDRKYLKFRLKDPRSLFFIPELGNNSVVTESARELLLPLESAHFLRFRPRKLSQPFSACPGHCDPRFFLPGTCHPCVVVK